MPTPPQPDGSVDLSFIEKVAREIAVCLDSYRVIVDKSTVPVKTGEKVAETIQRYAKPGVEFDVVSNPEFLREGCAVDDLMNPDRIVIGGNSDRALAVMQKVYEPFVAPVLVTDINSAELIKHAANSFLALKISYINAVSAICEASGADVEKVADGIGMDKRIGRNFLNAGLGYGGSCFPKDIAAFIAISDQLGMPFDLLEGSRDASTPTSSPASSTPSARRSGCSRTRRSPSGASPSSPTPTTSATRVAIELVETLVAEGAHVTAYDPKAHGESQGTPDRRQGQARRQPARGRRAARRRSSSPPSGRSSPPSISPNCATPCTPRSSSTGATCSIPAPPLAYGFQYRGIGRGTLPTANP